MESGRLNKSSRKSSRKGSDGRKFTQTEIAIDTDRKPSNSIETEEFKRKI